MFAWIHAFMGCFRQNALFLGTAKMGASSETTEEQLWKIGGELNRTKQKWKRKLKRW